MSKFIAILIFGAFLLVLSFYLGRLYERGGGPIGTLPEQINILAGSKKPFLPKGIKVYHVKSLPEGGDIIKVYVNYKGTPIEFKDGGSWFDINAVAGMSSLD